MVSELRKIILFPEALIYVFGLMSLAQKILFIFGFIGLLCLIFQFVIFPLVCEFYIVPRIEEKVGKKLGYSYILNLVPFGKYFNRNIEISSYILDRYYAFKKRGERSVPFGKERFSLKHVGYTIDMVSKPELIFAFLVSINLYVMGVSFAMATIAALLSQSS